MKIAIVCENASFVMGGEAAIPLRFFRNFRELGCLVKLYTHARVQNELQEKLSDEELKDVTFFEDTTVQKLIFKAGKILPMSLQEIFTYSLIRCSTEARQARMLRGEMRQGNLDIVFQPTPISPKALSLIRVPGVLVFFGPLNGAMDYPSAFAHKSGRVSRFVIRVARALSEPVHYLFRAKRAAAGIFVSNPRTARALPVAARKVTKFKSYDATIDAAHWRRVQRSGGVEGNHFLYVGRLVDWKAVEYAIRAVHGLDGMARLTIVGDGPERPRLEALASAGPAEITFTGYLPHERLLALYETVCAQILPSLREAGGNVCMEALAAGVPVIATRWGGPEDVVIDGVDGFLIEPSSEVDLIAGIQKSMQTLIEDPELAQTMGTRGRARVLDAFDWRVKAADYIAVFERAHCEGIDPSASGLVDIHPAHQGPEPVNVAWMPSR